jgi:3-dehydroquinate synthase
MNKIKVDLKENSYSIIVGVDILKDLGRIIKDEKWGKDIFIITDSLVNELYGDVLRKSLKDFKTNTIEVPRGERFKTTKTLQSIYDQMVKLSAHRDALIIALGGGVIGDMAGFVAATYMRGINYIQVPTTLLAQVDAAIGGKTGVNHSKGKNLIGAFYQPKMVYIDISTLATLAARELRTGLAEVVKYGIIKDESFFVFLENNNHHLNTKAFESFDTLRASLKVWATIVAESAKIKASVVSQDEREAGLRMILNFGHTVGHAIETLTKYNSFNHGEAVSIGMVAAAYLAVKLGIFEPKMSQRIVDLLDSLGLPTQIKGLSADKVIKVLEIDKKVKSNKLCLVLPEKIGKVLIKNDVPALAIKQALKEIGCR